MYRVLLLFIAESVSTLNTGSIDKIGKSAGGQEIISASPNLSPDKPNSTVTQGAASHREFTKVESSGPLPRLRGGNVYILVSDDYATKWLENCPSRRWQLRFQRVNNSLEVHISERTLMHLPLNLGVWGKA